MKTKINAHLIRLKKWFLIVPANLFYLSLSAQQTTDSLNISLMFEENSAYVKASYYLKTKTNTSDSVLFVLNPGFIINSITADNLTTYKKISVPGRPIPYLSLKFNKPLCSDTEYLIHFDYKIDLEKSNYKSYNWIEMMVDQFWYPNAHDVTNLFKSSLKVSGLYNDYAITSYQPYSLPGNYSFEVVQNIPSAEISFLAGKSMITEIKKEGNYTISFFKRKDTPDSTILSIQKKLIDIIELYNSLWGQTNRINEFSIVLRQVPRKIISGQTTRPFMVITGVEFNDYANLAHEIAHFWWNNADFLKEPWLNESFANYSMLLVLKHFDKVTYKRLLTQYEKQAEKPGVVYNAGVFEKDAYPLYYLKGTYLLTLLEEKIGESKMMELLRLRIKDKINTTADLLSTIEKNFGYEVKIYFLELISN